MSTVYFAADQESLAEKLLQHLEGRDDFFSPVTIVVPNDLMAKWLKLWVAERSGLAVNLRFLSLDDALCELFQPTHNANPKLLNESSMQLLALAALWDDEDTPELASLRNYIGYGGGERGRSYCRRAWQLAERLTATLREYEWHRSKEIIAQWQSGRPAFPNAETAIRNLEEGQRFVWRQIGNAISSPQSGSNQHWTTFAQIAAEVMQTPQTEAHADSTPICFFGFTYFTPLHIDGIGRLGVTNDIHIYLFDPFALSASQAAPNTVLHHLGKANAATRRMLMQVKHFDYQQVHANDKPTGRATVLKRLQQTLLGAPTANARRIQQDKSVQIVACPTIDREIETVYNTILHLLQTDPSLMQTDIAILTTDMERYRPVLQAVFDRRPLLQYSLSDFSAANVSTFGQALLDMIDLGLESFTRSRAFAVFLNPCFLAGLGIDHSQATTWLQWVDKLGIYYGWNRDDRKERGYADSSLYSWQWGLRRLRLGRFIESDTTEPISATRFENVVPFSDVLDDRENLDAFCRAVEGLLPMLSRWRKQQATGDQWADDIRQVIYQFLDVPADRSEEAQVRDHVLANLSRLSVLEDRRIPLALVREFLQSSLQSLQGHKGEPLVAGVTMAALQPMRALPFRVLFIIGLSEDLFPGSNFLPAFDLRNRQQTATDVGAADFHRTAFLETVLSVREKLLLLYTSRDLQKDQALQPSGPVTEIKRLLEESVVAAPFSSVETPMAETDFAYIDQKRQLRFADVLVNFDEADRLIAINEAVATGAATLNARQKKQIQVVRKRPDFTVLPCTGEATPVPQTVTIRELAAFLKCPASAVWRRHLRIRDEENRELDDDEPFRMAFPNDLQLMRGFLDQFIRCSIKRSLDEAIGVWPSEFEAYYDNWQDCGLAPEGAFADVDRDVFAEQLRVQLDPHGELVTLLAMRPSDEFCGPIAIGPSILPIGAKLRFPALEFAGTSAVLVGDATYAWRSDDALDLLVFVQKEKSKITAIPITHHMLEPVLFYYALRCGTQSATAGIASSQWVGERPLRLHLACRDGVVTFDYAAVAVESAREYLSDLVNVLLDPTNFDLLPFELVVSDNELRTVFMTPDNSIDAEQFCELLYDAYVEDQAGEYSKYRRPAFFDFAHPIVPKDALEKLRRRFRLLFPASG